MATTINTPSKLPKFITIPLIIFVIFLLIIVFANITNFFIVIGPGQRGILTELGKVKGVYDPGLHFQLPIINSVVVMDVRTQKLQENVDAASKDLQSIKGVIALNYFAEPQKVGQLYEQVGLNYEERIINPAIQESVKAVTARYTAEQLITERPKVKEEIEKEMTARVEIYGLNVSDVSIVNFDFSEEFNRSIEAKQTAVQNALKAENDLKRIQIEAQQKIETAKAEAESIRIQGEALRENGSLVNLKVVEKWNGVMPNYYVIGGNAPQPLISLPNK